MAVAQSESPAPFALHASGSSPPFAAEFFSTLDGLGIARSDLPNISAAIMRSATAIERARRCLSSTAALNGAVTVVGFGSLARHEMTVNSDLDYLFVSQGPVQPPEQLKSAVDGLRSRLVDDVVLNKPGSSSLFGTTVDLNEIVTKIGLQQDDNHNLSRRILLLEESVCLTDDDGLHRGLLARVLERYLAGRPLGGKRVPRVLVNDIVRYWRTIAIDYHAKSAESGQHYSLCYLKLLIPRKLCYIASIAPLFALDTADSRDDLEFLVEAFTNPAIVRLARLFATVTESHRRDRERMLQIARSAFLTLDEFVEKSGDPHWRQTVARECMRANPRESLEFGEMRRLGCRLREQVAELLLSDAMLAFTKDYLLT